MVNVATLITDMLGDDLPVRCRAWDGSAVGPENAPAVVVLRSPDQTERVVAISFLEFLRQRAQAAV